MLLESASLQPSNLKIAKNEINICLKNNSVFKEINSAKKKVQGLHILQIVWLNQIHAGWDAVLLFYLNTHKKGSDFEEGN